MNSGASFWVESLCKNIQLTLAFLKAPLLVLHVSCYTFMVLVMMISVTLLFNLMILLSTLWSASGLWKQLELASELESVLRNTVDWDKKWSGFNGKISMLENLSWYITFINKIASTKFGVFILSLKFLSSEVGLYLYNLYTSLHSTLLSYLNWCSQLLLRYFK